MMRRVLLAAVLALLPSAALATCQPIIGMSDWTACALNASDSVECWGTDQYTLLTTIPAGAMTSLAGGDTNMCAIETDTSIACWGSDAYDLIEDMPAGTGFVFAEPGTVTACALETDDTVTCWGGDKCVGGTRDGLGCATPLTCPGGVCTPLVTFTVAEGGNSYNQISGNYDTYCGVKTDGSLHCWGRDYGDGVFTEAAGTSWVKVEGTSDHACALDNAGGITCWGANAEGQSTVPAGTYLDIAVALEVSCAIQTDGDLDCWGNDFGVGIQTPPAGTFTKLVISAVTACATTSADDIKCWGDDTAAVVSGSTGEECRLPSYIVSFVGQNEP